MPLWFQVETRVRTHPKMLLAGRAASWTWLAGNCYAKEQMTDGFLPDAIVVSLLPGVPARELKKDAEKLVTARLWSKVQGGYQIKDFLKYNDSKLEVEAKLEKDRKRKKADSDILPLGIPTDSNSALLLSTSTSESEGKERKPHPIRDFLTEHKRLFIARHLDEPADYTGKDAKTVDKLIKKRGNEKALALLRQLFASLDPFIAKSGHGVGLLANDVVQNKLVAELSASARTSVPAQVSSSLRLIDEMEAKRHAG